MRYVNSTNILEKSHKLYEQRPIRILQVVGGMARAGTETWLMHILRNIDRKRFQMDFLVHTTEPCAYDEEIRTLGCRIIPCLNLSRPWLYAKNFKRILREYGPYDIVHSHVHHFSGYVLLLSQQEDVPIRIAHSHLDTSQLDAQAKLLRYGYLKLMTYWINRYATFGLAASRAAAEAMFGLTWHLNPYRKVLYCAVDLHRFHELVNPTDIRAELNIPPGAFVVGHVGRFEKQKNHHFLIDIATEIAKREPNMYLLLVGHGSLYQDIKHQVKILGLSDRVIFAGTRSDVPRLMLGAIDVFLFPSLCEGLGLVLVEAQAAGIPCIFSDVVPEEANIVIPLIHRLSLSKQANVWAELVLETRNKKIFTAQSDALSIVEQSDFNIKKGVEKIVELYRLLL